MFSNSRHGAFSGSRHGVNAFDSIIIIISISSSSSKPGGSYISLITTTYNKGGYRRTGSSYYVGVQSWVCLIPSFSFVGFFRFITFIKYNSFMVHVSCTDDDSINNNTANTSKKPDAILTLYVVYDLVLAGGDKAVLTILKEKLMIRFATTDMGFISLILGMQVNQNRESGTLTISQADYTRTLDEKYGLGASEPVSTPGIGKELSLDQSEGDLLNAIQKQR